MKHALMRLYKITWKHTGATYVVSGLYDENAIKNMVRQHDERCDDITRIEKVFLPAFENDNVRDSEYVSMYYEEAKIR